MNQGEFTSIYCARPQNFSWFLGAGASRSAGLPTATDIIWDLKCRYYCREENQDVSRQDIQNHSVRARIQSFMESRGFPQPWSNEEYPTYFEKIFGDDKERQRRYLKAILSEDKVTLSVGNRVLGALLSSGFCRIVFTTNFDSVVERAVAQVSGQSLSAYHLEGSRAAKRALDNEEYPIYCKLHGDFRYDSLKNLPSDLMSQNEALAECLVNASNRLGLVVAGYSGRDKSVMTLFESVLSSRNPFPHGLYWAGIKGSAVSPDTENLLEMARSKGVEAHYIGIETFDALMLRLWRNLENKSAEIDAIVRRSQAATVDIPLPGAGRAKPIIRLNALPVVSLPAQCLSLSFRTPRQWSDLRQARADSEGQLVLTKSDSVFCWGSRERVKKVFAKELSEIDVCDLPANLGGPENLHFRGFIEEAICTALVRGKPLLTRTTRYSSVLIAAPHFDETDCLDPLFQIVGKTSGQIAGLFAPITEHKPEPERVSWAESLRVSLDYRDGKFWLLVDPDIWIWPPRARQIAVQFLDGRRGDRFNRTYNALLDAWVNIILGSEKNAEFELKAFDEGGAQENPTFRIGSRTAFARRLVG